MGIHGLWSLLKVSSIPITLEELEGKRLAIDISLWIHQAQKGCLNNERSNKPHLTLLINRIAKLLFYKIRPVFVFDGENVPRFKKQILRDRQMKRHLQEISITRDQKRLFEHIAENKNFNSNESSADGYKKKSKIKRDFLNSSNGNSTFIFTHEIDSDSSNDNANNCGIYSSMIDAQISKLEEHRERERNELLERSEIPDGADQFSNFQLQRLLQRSKTNTQLKMDKVRNTVDILQNDGNNYKLIISDKHQNVHILKSKEEGKVNQESLSVTSMNTSNNISRSDDTASSVSSSDSDDFIDVSDSEMPNNESIKCIDDDIVVVDKFIFEINDEVNTRRNFNTENLKENGRVDNKINEFLYSNIHSKNSSKDDLITDRDVIYSDCQKLLFILGLPFMESPGEAEAQCVELEKLNLVDGIISDDSDVWLFGAKNVYKNMFNRKIHLEKYTSEDIKLKLGLTRCEFIQLGLLSGGDYSKGLEQVGIITSLELISEFINSDNCESINNNLLHKVVSPLNKISEWILSKRQKNAQSFIESPKRIRLRKIIESNNSDEIINKFPNVEIIETYVNPVVDSSTKKFIWKRMDFDALDSFLKINLGITKEDIFNKTHGAFQRWDTFITGQTQSYQQKITNFMRTTLTSLDDIKTNNTFLSSERIKNAVNKLKNNQRENL